MPCHGIKVYSSTKPTQGVSKENNDNKRAVRQRTSANIATNLHPQVSKLTSSSVLCRLWLDFRIQILLYLPLDHGLDHHAKKVVLYGTVTD
jgi:hypothetical protein